MAISTSFIIGDYTFSTKEAFINSCQEILHRDKWDTVIDEADAELVKAVFNAREDKVVLLQGRKVVKFWRKMHRHNTPCFFAELDDGNLLDFSFMKLTKPVA